MNLLSGTRLTVLPRFHLPIDWPQRLLLSTGTKRADDNLLPRTPWRPATERELALLIRDPALPAVSEDLADCLCFFQIPRHLGQTFWKMLEQASEGGKARLDGFDDFSREVTRFLTFKGLSVPAGATCELVRKQPGQPPNLAHNQSLWAGINLGDEPTSIVFLNLMPRHILQFGDSLQFGDPQFMTLEQYLEFFQNHHPDFPLVQLRIEPGEGYLLPAGGLPLDGSTLDTQEPAVSLMLFANLQVDPAPGHIQR